MAKEIFGEASLDTGEAIVTLRFDIGTMLEMEDYFNLGTLHIIATVVPRMRAKDLAVLYLAMTGGNWRVHENVTEAVTTIMAVGLADTGTAISECLTRTLMAGKGNAKPSKKKTTKPPKT